jgi:succinate dehydrogenase / fumarate reductase flavoprotein subunit
MTAMENITGYDILIIGGGAAGLRAAIAAAETDASLKIAIISKVYPTRSHTVSAEGGIAAAMREYDSVENHAYDTVKGSDFLADQDAVEFFTGRAREEIVTLEHWGCPWSREENGKIAVRAFGGMNVKRTVYAADKTGFYLLHSLFERSLLYENITRFDEWYVTGLITDDHGIGGIEAIRMKTGGLAAIRAKAVIMATGGAGRVYKFTTNSALNTGDGLALAYEAGAALKDMEFVQFHPTAMAKTGILITEAARGEGGHLVNRNGERFLKKYLPEKMELGPRDLVSRAILSEIRDGNGCSGAHGEHVLLDIRHLGKKTIDEKLPLVREIAMSYGNTDPVSEPIAVRPAQHYTMGGISTDINTQSTLPGLFAAGEAACVTIHGANRLGSNSLAECIVFGAQAGKSAAEYCLKHHHKQSDNQASGGQRLKTGHLLKTILENEGKESIADIRNRMQETMDACAGILRDGKELVKGLSVIKELAEKSDRIGIADKSLVFNTSLTSLLELKSMLKVCEIIFECALRREESRGAHYRTDFPLRDDSRFLKHHLAVKDGKDIKISDLAVTMTKWEPEERKY